MTVPIIRMDIPPQLSGETWDDAVERIYNALREGEIANGFRRRGDCLDHVGISLEYLAQFDADIDAE